MRVSMPSSRRIFFKRRTEGRIHSIRASGINTLARTQVIRRDFQPFLPLEASMNPALIFFPEEKTEEGSMMCPRWMVSPGGISAARLSSVTG